MISPKVQAAIDAGVDVRSPETVTICDDVAIDRISPQAVIHPGCRISGASTSMGPEAEIGPEGPAVVEGCQIGRGAKLGGGFFSGATFLDGSSMGGSAHVRPGTLIEEQAGGAHAVGLKQTVLFPYVTAGSLINFCDCLMSGGTSRKNHSEIGSSYIHFNFTPHGDKATASLIGDVPRGVMLDQPPIFLGGQGGLVGPRYIEFGTILGAGVICRHDVTEGGKLVTASGSGSDALERSYIPGLYGSIERTVSIGLAYIGNIIALKAWYEHMRKPFMERNPFARACWEGAVTQLDRIVKERTKRLGDLAGRMEASMEHGRHHRDTQQSEHLVAQKQLKDRWPRIEEELSGVLSSDPGQADRDAFLKEWASQTNHSDYTDAVHSLSPSARVSGTQWLQAIVNGVSALWGPPTP